MPGAGPGSWDGYQGRALDALVSAEARGAFQIEREDPKIRDRYGRHIHGQCLLLARRLVEAGVGLVTVNWHDDGRNFWDTHGDNFNRLKNDLMPPADRGFAALLDDLDARGLLDETLVVWAGEFGRAPRITAANAGREHWPRCYSVALAGGGDPRRPGLRGQRPLGRLPRPRPGRPRRPRRHDPPRPRDRPRRRGPRPRRPAPADQQRHPDPGIVRLIRRRRRPGIIPFPSGRSGASHPGSGAGPRARRTTRGAVQRRVTASVGQPLGSGDRPAHGPAVRPRLEFLPKEVRRSDNLQRWVG